MKSLQHPERRRILALFLDAPSLLFSEIEKQIGLRSNHVAYHIDAMVKDHILQKEGDGYILTAHGESFLPRIKQLSGKEQGPLVVVVAAPIHEDRICLLRRKKRPYQGYWGCPGGKSRLSESDRKSVV